nr:retrotransposon protein, putative, Ty1-copia subclass [Tanacetum cinerariifolium]
MARLRGGIVPYLTWYVKFLEKNLISQEANKRAVELEEVQDKDTSPYKNSSKHLVEAESFKPPQEDVAPVHRSVKTHRAPKRLYPEFNKWLDAMNEKMQSIKDDQVWRLVDLSYNGKTIGSKWLFKKKTDMDDKCLAMKDLREAAFILETKIYRDRSKRLIGLSQSACMDKMLKRFKMDDSKRANISMKERLDLNKTQGPQSHGLQILDVQPFDGSGNNVSNVIKGPKDAANHNAKSLVKDLSVVSYLKEYASSQTAVTAF